MAAEVGLIVLDCIGLYCTECRDQILSADESPLTDKIFEIYLTFLQVGQSESILGHVFAALRAFVNNFPPILFQGDASNELFLRCFIKFNCRKRSNLRAVVLGTVAQLQL